MNNGNYVLIEGDLYFLCDNNYYIKVTEHFSISGNTIDSLFVDYITHISA